MRLACALVLGVVVSLVPWRAHGTEVNLDPTFGTFGQVVVDIPGGDDAAQDVLVQPDGAIVTAGFFEDQVALVRVTSTGALDATFGTGGIVTTNVGEGNGVAVARQSDGKLVVVGYADFNTNGKFLVVRYNGDGTLDGTFGSGGIVRTDIDADYDAASGVAIQPDGKLVVVGFRVINAAATITVVRYETDGSLDATFGTGGIVETILPNGSSLGEDVALQPDGKIVVSGQVAVAYGNSAFVVVRYNANGSLDSGFGNNGAVITDFGFDSDVAHAVSVLPDGRIVAGAQHGGRFAATRYLSNGSPDGAFGVGGSAIVDLVPGFDLGFDLVVQPDGKVVLAGYAQRNEGGLADVAVVRLDTAGAPDTTFAPGGGATLRLGDDSTTAVGLARQPDGKLVVAGWNDKVGNSVSTFIARLGGSCGDAFLDANEQCDDGNTNGLDCCSVGCGLVPAGGTCEFDGNICTADVCDGAGTCTLGGPKSVCNAPSSPRKAKLTILNDANDSHDKLEFKWTKGTTQFFEFGLPNFTTDYTLCIFAGPGSAPPLVYQGEIPAGIWAQNNYKYLFKDVTGANDGFVKGLLKGRFGQHSSALLKAKGTNVSPPSLALATPVTAQLRGSNDACFGATFATPSLNTPTRFKAKGQ